MTKTNVQPTPRNSKHHDTLNNKTHVIKFRVTKMKNWNSNDQSEN